MARKLYLPFILLSSLVLTLIGCGQNDDNTMEDQNAAEQLNPDLERTTENNNDPLINKLGYVRYTKDELNEDDENNREITMNRNEVADIITRIILRNDDFAEVATLVTDEQVLIAYRKNEDNATKYTPDIAKQSARSIVPAYFEVYVSDQEQLMNDIHSLQNSTTQNKNYENTVNSIINEMKKSSQGVDKKMQN
ncbi:YhcN/YlaJ family sporulation lipoprotein [Virgibacillus sp. W0430]|uniref:YhcN/YlaJ family sporulation lipoprotein n=1 Tax=Virgibacillus sp. W0430 TaxID=3391580 RepID=UPI003F44E6C8